ncbi:MAG: NAD(+) diphosphatase, partial [Erysipelotrichaceae bacterium]
TAYFLDLTASNVAGLQWVDIHQFRTWQPQSDAFAMMVAYQLHRWYQSHRFCGVCGNPTMHHSKERACVCTVCQHIVYPTIAPAIIVGIIDGERLLLTKYAKGIYQKYALVAGFMEIGETLEACVKREVKEEVGLDVEDIVYYKSQPWPLSSTILVGFFAHVCGSHEVTLDQEELSEATWFQREDIVAPDSLRSLTADMIEAFRTGTYLTLDDKKRTHR